LKVPHPHPTEKTQAFQNPSKENLAEVKRFISQAAGAFGRSLSDVTKAIKDSLVDTWDTVSGKAIETASAAGDYLREKLTHSKE
jgi:hypothetical protein